VRPKSATTDPGSPRLKGLRAYVGAAPITRASGKNQIRHAPPGQEQPAQAAGYSWVFSALTASPASALTTADAIDVGDPHVPPSATCTAAACWATCGTA